MKTANGTITRTKREQTADWVRDKPAIKRRLAGALKEDHGQKHSHLKLIARQAGASPRTVEGWTDGHYLMGLDHFLRLVPTSPAIQKMLDELRTIDPDTDPRYGPLVNAIRRMG